MRAQPVAVVQHEGEAVRRHSGDIRAYAVGIDMHLAAVALQRHVPPRTPTVAVR